MKGCIHTPAKTITIPSLRLSWLHLVVLGLVFALMQQCGENKSLKNEVSSAHEVFRDSIRYYKNKTGEMVASKRALEGSEASLQLLIEELKDSTQQLRGLVKHFKKVAAALQTKTSTVITDIEVPYEIPGQDFSIPFEKINPFYRIAGRSTSAGLFLDNITIPNTQTIVIGDRKEGFFKREFRMDVVNSNPYITTEEMNSFVYKEKQKRLGIGLSAGYGFSKEGLSPFVGLTINYSLIRL